MPQRLPQLFFWVFSSEDASPHKYLLLPGPASGVAWPCGSLVVQEFIMFETGFAIFLGITFIFIKLRRRTMLRLLRYDIAIDLSPC